MDTQTPSVAAEMVAAVRAGDTNALLGILQRHPAHAKVEGEDSPLRIALYHGRRDLAELMRAHGWQLDAFDAAALGDADALRAALDAEPSILDRISNDGWTMLHLAAFFGHEDVVALLLERGADPHVVSENAMRNTPLHAALAGPLGMDGVRRLLDAGADVNARQHGGYTPLHSAAGRGALDLIQLLLERGADPEASAEDGKRPVDFARERGHPAAAAYLAELGATSPD